MYLLGNKNVTLLSAIKKPPCFSSCLLYSKNPSVYSQLGFKFPVYHYYYFRIYNISFFPFRRSHEFNLSDCAPYFLSNVKRLSDSAYIPTTQDILHTRIPTCGIVEVRNFSKCADIICVSFFYIIIHFVLLHTPFKIIRPMSSLQSTLHNIPQQCTRYLKYLCLNRSTFIFSYVFIEVYISVR